MTSASSDHPPNSFMRVLARWAPPAAVLAALLVIYWQALLPGWTFAGADFLQLFYPLKQYSMESWAAGRPPFWNPYSFLGAPFLASMQPAALYPPDVMLLALRGDLLWAMKAQLFLHLCVMAMGCYWLYRVGAGGERWGAALGALAVTGGAFVRFHLEHINQVAALAWAPWIVGVAWMALALGRRRALLALPGLLALQILAGHPQHVYNTLLVLGGMGVYGLIAGRERKTALINAGLMALGALGGAGLAAPQLLPAMELAALSPRAGQSVGEALAFSLPPERLWAFIHPRLGLTPENLLSYTNMYGEFGCYLGLIPLALAVVGAGVIAAWRRTGPGLKVLMRAGHDDGSADRWRWLWPLGAVFCVIMALGGYAKVYPLLAGVLPGMSGFRVPARWLFFAMLFLGGMAQYGWAFVAERASRQRNLRLLSRPAWIGFLTLILTAVDLQVTPPPGPLDRQVQTRLLETPAGWEALAGPLERDGYARVFRFETADGDHTLNNSPEGVRERRLRLQPEGNMAARVPVLFGYEQALLPPRALLALQAHYNRNLRWSDPDAELLALLGVRWVMSDFELKGAHWRPLPLRAVSGFGGPGMRFYENAIYRGATFAEEALAQAVDWAAFAPGADGPLTMERSRMNFEYKSAAGRVFGDDSGTTSGGVIYRLQSQPGGNYEVTVLDDKISSVIRERGVRIVWSQMAMPGWRAIYESNGVEIEQAVERLGPFHQAIELPANVAFFKLTYVPTGWYKGGWIMIILMIFYLVLAIWSMRGFRSRDAYVKDFGRE